MRTIARRFLLSVIGLSAVIMGVGLGFLLSGDEDDPNVSPLVGMSAFDFGRRTFAGGALELQHTFVLTNQSKNDVQIGNVASTCGCTAAEISKSQVKPGETVDVFATLTTTRAGRRTEHILLALGENRVHRLMLTVVAQRMDDFFAAQKSIRLARGHPEQVILVAATDSNDLVPTRPKILVPEGIEATLGEWRLVLDADVGRPARWQMVVRFEQATPLAESAEVLIKLDKERELTLNLTGWPW